VILSPELYAEVSTYELLSAANRGEAGLDHRFFHAILDRGEAAIPDLARFGLQPPKGERLVFDEDLLHIFRQLRTPQALPFYVEFARRHDFKFSVELEEAFADLGAASLEPLLALHREAAEPPDVNSALVALGVRDPRILEALLEELATDSAGGAVNLGRYGDAAAIPALEAALAKTDPEDEWLRDPIEDALEQIRSGEPPETPEPFDLWPLYPEQCEPDFEMLSVEELLEFLGSPVADYRVGAVKRLATGTLTAEACARIFELAQNDPDAHVRQPCWEALEGSVNQPAIRTAMLERLADPSAPLDERCGALVGLAGAAGDPAVRRRMLEFCARPETRARALEAMWHSQDRSFGEHFPRYLNDPDHKVRCQAILGVGYLEVSAAAERLRPFFTDPELREEALYAYALAAPAEVTPARMRGLFRRIREVTGDLSGADRDVIRMALNKRLEAHGHPRVFSAYEVEDEGSEPYVAPAKIGRNDPCPCGSGKKYKKCCGR